MIMLPTNNATHLEPLLTDSVHIYENTDSLLLVRMNRLILIEPSFLRLAQQIKVPKCMEKQCKLYENLVHLAA